MPRMNPASVSFSSASTATKTMTSPTLCPAPQRTPSQNARQREFPHASDATALM